MDKSLVIYALGIHAAAFAIFHAFFWKIFRWKTGLDKVSKPNRAILQIANVQLIFVFLVIATACFTFATELSGTSLGRFFLISIALFWMIRLLQQFIFLRINHWMVHTLTMLFVLGAMLAAWPLF